MREEVPLAESPGYAAQLARIRRALPTLDRIASSAATSMVPVGLRWCAASALAVTLGSWALSMLSNTRPTTSTATALQLAASTRAAGIELARINAGANGDGLEAVEARGAQLAVVHAHVDALGELLTGAVRIALERQRADAARGGDRN